MTTKFEMVDFNEAELKNITIGDVLIKDEHIVWIKEYPEHNVMELHLINGDVLPVRLDMRCEIQWVVPQRLKNNK